MTIFKICQRIILCLYHNIKENKYNVKVFARNEMNTNREYYINMLPPALVYGFPPFWPLYWHFFVPQRSQLHLQPKHKKWASK